MRSCPEVRKEERIGTSSLFSIATNDDIGGSGDKTAGEKGRGGDEDEAVAEIRWR